jgi:hypothetical protein
MKKKIAREYFLFLVGLGVTGLTFLSLVVWTKYYESLSQDQFNSLTKVEEDLRKFNKIYKKMTSCYYDIGSRDQFARDILKVQVVENIYSSLNEAYSDGTISYCEIDLRDYLLGFYKTPFDMHLAFYYDNKGIVEHQKIERQKLDGLVDNIIPYNAEAFRNTVGYRVFRVNRNLENLTTKERNSVESYLWDFYRYNDEYDLFEVPLDEVDVFISNVPIVEEVTVSTPFGKTILSKTAIVAGIYFLLFFLLRYFYYTVVWSIRTMRAK